MIALVLPCSALV